MSLAQRTPSANWEPLLLDHAMQLNAWVWYRPQGAPNGLSFSLPIQLFSQPHVLPRLTVRQLVFTAGLDANQIHCWSQGGMTLDAGFGTSPYLDQVVPAPPPGSNVTSVEISVWMIPEPQPIWPAAMQPGPELSGFIYGPSAPSGGAVSELDQQSLSAIDSNWNSILQIEARISSVRKELGSSIARLNSLNRDLSIDEKRACDSKDTQDWSDARRWMRDSLSTLSRSVKEIDVGTISGAGQRHRFVDLYQNHVVPRIPWPGLSQAVIDFESYRKIIQNVLAAAQSNLSKAGRDAEQRANSLLQRIGVKMRANRRK